MDYSWFMPPTYDFISYIKIQLLFHENLTMNSTKRASSPVTGSARYCPQKGNECIKLRNAYSWKKDTPTCYQNLPQHHWTLHVTLWCFFSCTLYHRSCCSRHIVNLCCLQTCVQPLCFVTTILINAHYVPVKCVKTTIKVTQGEALNVNSFATGDLDIR